MNESQRREITTKSVVYSIPGMEGVTIRKDIEYRATPFGALTMDIYYPAGSGIGSRIPAVVFVSGYSDLGCQKIFGCKLKEMASYISWGQLTAASGLVAITYSATEPVTDLDALLSFVRRNAASLGIGEGKIGIWACSGNVPNALSVFMAKSRDYLRCAVLCYGVMLDLDGSRDAAELAGSFGFVNPCAGRTVDDLARNIPLFIVRAGRDEIPHLNQTIDRFLARALGSNLPLTLINHASAPHAFDLWDDSEESREIIRQILAFLRFHLL